jgi:predicted nucleotidyltransferase
MVESSLRLRDRDAIVSSEGIIFRVYGYSHPPEGYICDVEYAPSSIYVSDNPNAFRAKNFKVFYKFYADEGINFILEKFPKYTVFYEPLQKRLIGVKNDLIAEVRKPENKLRALLLKEPEDELTISLRKILNLILSVSGLSAENFGVFGSILHDFYHPLFSDIDLIIYGKKNLRALRDALEEIYSDPASKLRNEFISEESIKGKRWRFKNYSAKEFLWHQHRKMIYAIFESDYASRRIKVEFEPVREWNEIHDEYGGVCRIVNEGWIKARARVLDDYENAFMPSIYPIEIVDVLEGPRADEIKRVISFVEEFRMQAWKDEMIYVEGNLERVNAKNEVFYQITLTYEPRRYYEQTLKVTEPN